MRICSVLLFFLLIFSGCNISGTKTADTKTFIILDQASNKVLNTYEYDQTDTLLRTESFNSEQKAVSVIEYQYDSRGNLLTTQEIKPGGKSIYNTYTTDDKYDSSSRLIKSTRTSSDGTIIETYYGYDENGILRGVVEQTDKDSVIMKDYEN